MRKLFLSLLFLIGAIPVIALASCPQFIFFCNNPNRCDGRADFALEVCPASVTGPYTVDYVEWFINGVPVVTNGLSYTHSFSGSGSRNITATVHCTTAGGQCSSAALNASHATPTIDNLCSVLGSATTVFTVFVSNLDFSLFLADPVPPETIYNNTPVDVNATYINTLGVDPEQVNVWVDDVPLVVNGSAFLTNVLTDYLFEEGQHLIEMSVGDKGAGCLFTDELLIEVLDSGVGTTCPTCFTFRPTPGERYWFSAWVQTGVTGPVKTYEDLGVYASLSYSGSATITKLYPTGEIIDGWQRIAGEFTVPPSATVILVKLVNDNASLTSYFDDVRVHPFNASMKSYVNDPETFWLLAELDDNNYATFYEYDKEGKLIRIKKETERGVMTIQESRMSNPKKQ